MSYIFSCTSNPMTWLGMPNGMACPLARLAVSFSANMFISYSFLACFLVANTTQPCHPLTHIGALFQLSFQDIRKSHFALGLARLVLRVCQPLKALLGGNKLCYNHVCCGHNFLILRFKIFYSFFLNFMVSNLIARLNVLCFSCILMFNCGKICHLWL